MCQDNTENTDYEESKTYDTIHDAPEAWKNVDHGLSGLDQPNTLVLKRGLHDFNGVLVLMSFVAVLANLAITSFLLLAVFDKSIDYETVGLRLIAVFFAGMFNIVFLFILGYTLGKFSITGVTKMFARYVYVICLGTLVYSLGWLFYASSDLLLHYASYLLLALSVLLFVYGFMCLSKHKSDVGDWTAIGDNILAHDPFLAYDDWLQGALVSGGIGDDPFCKNRFLVIKTGNEVKLYERRDIVTEEEYTQILGKQKGKISI